MPKELTFAQDMLTYNLTLTKLMHLIFYICMHIFRLAGPSKCSCVQTNKLPAHESWECLVGTKCFQYSITLTMISMITIQHEQSPKGNPFLIVPTSTHMGTQDDCIFLCCYLFSVTESLIIHTVV